MRSSERVEIELIPASQNSGVSSHEFLPQRRVPIDRTGYECDIDGAAVALIAILGLCHLTCEIGIGLEGANGGAHGIAGVQLLREARFIMLRTPTLVVAQSADHRVGRFGIRTRLLRPKARKTGTEVELERRCNHQRRLRYKCLAGPIEPRFIRRSQRRVIPLLVITVEFEAEAEPVRAKMFTLVLRFDAGVPLNQSIAIADHAEDEGVALDG